MSPPPVRFLARILLVATLLPASAGTAWGQPTPRPIRGTLIAIAQATPQALADWKSEGGNAVIVVLDESIPRPRWSELSRNVEREGLALYAWIEVARNPSMADAHPEWMATPGGHHDDWRRRFPKAPVVKAGEVVKAWPWVPIGYAPAFEAHRKRLRNLLLGLPGEWAGVFLNDLQAGPSSCGCGNDQCRWALDYGSPSTAARTPGDDAAARLVAEIAAIPSGKSVIPVWVTECEMIDLPRVAGSTGSCGNVECAKTACWPRYSRSWNPLLKATSGPLAVALWSGSFGRDPAWVDEALGLFGRPPGGGDAVSKDRILAVLQGWDVSSPDRAKLAARASRAGGGWVIATTRIDQSWEPRVVKIPRQASRSGTGFPHLTGAPRFGH
jgi:hypothetical protein